VRDLSRYELEALRTEGDLILYRGKDRDGHSPVLVLSPAGQHPSAESLKRLDNEFSLKNELDASWAAQPLGLATHWGRTVLLLRDPGGVPLESAFGSWEVSSSPGAGARQFGDQGTNGLDLGLRVAVNLAAAIGAVHQQGIIHKDIKPANVLIDPASGRCWLTGFGVASRLSRERQLPAPPEFIAGTLAYMAPEQTGRMNRSIDSRSDLYALGVTLYQMFTGTLPFSASDPMEWVHCHIARQPLPPNQRSQTIPEPVSAIVMKLLAKTAEERYQTAAGVQADLQRCLDELEGSRPRDPLLRRARTRALPSNNENGGPIIAPFPLGQHDTPDRLRIPEKLYGRDREIETLLASFDRVVANGRPELVLVSGYSGVGKSSVVNELHKVLVPPRGLFASGKFDQHKRNIPYWTLARAFQNLVRPLLAKSEVELSQWRKALQEAVGSNGRLIVDLIPELELIIGQQPPVADLASQEAKARFQLVFRRFVAVFTSARHPLALFIDDLQWLDTATLDFLEDLLTQPDVHHLLLIGAYRDNEIELTHPLWHKLEAVRQAGTEINNIVLAPLTCQDLGQLLVDTLHGDSKRIQPLAQLIHAKTAGNPFFAIQFVMALAEENFLSFDHDAGSWSWDLNRIQAKGYTDNVADLMVGKLHRLPSETQKALQEFACLGNSTTISTLSMIRGLVLRSRDGEEGPVLRPVRHSLGDGGSSAQPNAGGISEQHLVSDLWEAERLEFIVRSEGVYRFTHDRVQEAAYSLIPANERAEAHLRIGRLLKAHTLPQNLEESVFEIVSQLNRGAALIASRQEREEVAALNLLAGERAQTSTAFALALKYFVSGASLLGEDTWERNHELAFALEFHRAECEFLTYRAAAAEERLRMLLLSSRAANTVELAAVTCLRVDLYMTLNRSDRAIAIGLDYLRYLGIDWSPHPTEEEVRAEYDRIWTNMGNRTTEQLIDLPLMSDPASLATMDVLTKITPAAGQTDACLNSLVVCRMVNLTLEHGSTDGSVFAYVSIALLAAPNLGNYTDGFRFGQLGYELIEKRGLKRFQARTYTLFASHVLPWTKHVRACRDLLYRAFVIANEAGDLVFATVAYSTRITNLLVAGDPLADVEREAEQGCEFALKTRLTLMTPQLALVRTLRGLTEKFGSFDHEQFNELRFERDLAGRPPGIRECFYWILKLQARFLAGDFAAAIEASLKARRLLWTAPSHFETAAYHFYSALSRAALLVSGKSLSKEGSSFGAEIEKRDLSPEHRMAQEEHFSALIEHHQQIAIWAKNCPENFENQTALVGAEIARIEGRPLDAMDLYEQAIRSARTNGFIQNEATASELASHFYAARGFDLIAQEYLQKARDCYRRWGANGKVRQLDHLNPQLGVPKPASSLSGVATQVDQLDLATLIKVSHALSGEIILEKLVDTLMRTAIEHAGAERGLLIVPRDDEYRIESEATTSGDTIMVSVREMPVTATVLPESILRYVTRTKEIVILDDASIQNRFSEDDYLLQRRSKSVLCLPLLKQGKLMGALYLENSLTPRVFTPSRLTVLELLASQAAISLDNARLYAGVAQLNAELTQENSDRRRAEEALRTSEQRLQDIIDNTPAAIFVKDLELRYLLINSEFEHRHNVRRDEIRGKEDFDILPYEVAKQVRANDAQVIAAGAPIQFEEVVPSTQGNRWNICSKFLLRDRNGAPYAVCGIATDITERRQAEDALQQAQAEIARVSRMTTMEQLAASIAHEVNQPLAAVVTSGDACLHWLAATPPNFHKARRAVERMVRDGNRASDVLKRVRTLLRKAPLTKSPVNVNEVIQEALALVAGELRKQGVEFSTELDLTLPSVTADFVQLQQVLLNLVMNAIESMAGNTNRTKALHIQSRLEDKAQLSAVLVAVSDTGAGLSATEMEQVFEAFYSTKPEGMGMGLWICRSIIEAHGGGLTAQVNDAGGATFQFVLPSSREEGT
jgi:PAS domain S-box-containing protein